MSSKIVKNPLAIQRGQRLLLVRKLTGQVSKNFAALCGIGRTTISGWEQGINLLTEKGADKVSQSVRHKAGIQCSTLWLLHGIGHTPEITEPRKLSKLSYAIPKTQANATIEETTPIHYYEEDLEKEIALFKHSFSNCLICRVADTAMYPYYRKGDHVGGVSLSPQTWEMAHSMDCIVRLQDNRIMLRRIKIDYDEDIRISLYVANPEAALDHPPLKQLNTSQVLTLAPIIRVWRSTL